MHSAADVVKFLPADIESARGRLRQGGQRNCWRLSANNRTMLNRIQVRCTRRQRPLERTSAARKDAGARLNYTQANTVACDAHCAKTIRGATYTQASQWAVLH